MTGQEMFERLKRAYTSMGALKISGRENAGHLIAAMDEVEGVACAIAEQMRAEAEQKAAEAEKGGEKDERN